MAITSRTRAVKRKPNWKETAKERLARELAVKKAKKAEDKAKAEARQAEIDKYAKPEVKKYIPKQLQQTVQPEKKKIQIDFTKNDLIQEDILLGSRAAKYIKFKAQNLNAKDLLKHLQEFAQEALEAGNEALKALINVAIGLMEEKGSRVNGAVEAITEFKTYMEDKNGYFKSMFGERIYRLAENGDKKAIEAILTAPKTKNEEAFIKPAIESQLAEMLQDALNKGDVRKLMNVFEVLRVFGEEVAFDKLKDTLETAHSTTLVQFQGFLLNSTPEFDEDEFEGDKQEVYDEYSLVEHEILRQEAYLAEDSVEEAQDSSLGADEQLVNNLITELLSARKKEITVSMEEALKGSDINISVIDAFFNSAKYDVEMSLAVFYEVLHSMDRIPADLETLAEENNCLSFIRVVKEDAYSKISSWLDKMNFAALEAFLDRYHDRQSILDELENFKISALDELLTNCEETKYSKILNILQTEKLNREEKLKKRLEVEIPDLAALEEELSDEQELAKYIEGALLSIDYDHILELKCMADEQNLENLSVLFVSHSGDVEEKLEEAEEGSDGEGNEVFTTLENLDGKTLDEFFNSGKGITRGGKHRESTESNDSAVTDLSLKSDDCDTIIHLSGNIDVLVE